MEIVKRFIAPGDFTGTVAYRYELVIDGEMVGFRVIGPTGATTVVGLVPPSTMEEQTTRQSNVPLGPPGGVWVMCNGIHLTAVTASDEDENEDER